MKIFKNILNSVAYYYYPKFLHESDDSYQKTREYGNYILLHNNWKNFKGELKPLIDEIKNGSIGHLSLIFNGTPNNTPCYEIELLLQSNAESKKVIVLYLSMFVPFYHLVLLEREDSTNQIVSSTDIPKDLEKKVAEAVKKTLCFQKFPEDILHCSIPDLEVSSEFNYLTAFFTDWYRIAHI
ncbi:hypothetical protein [Spongiimicrobium sp. 3-5]|uniref:hypothetical protein n=1 Tax=Spongiimicrobium sp. 3-5 TaxID=3332596 RepID=UPI00397E9E33